MWWIQDFPLGVLTCWGGANLWHVCFLVKTCKNERIGSCWGACTRGAPWICQCINKESLWLDANFNACMTIYNSHSGILVHDKSRVTMKTSIIMKLSVVCYSLIRNNPLTKAFVKNWLYLFWDMIKHSVLVILLLGEFQHHQFSSLLITKWSNRLNIWAPPSPMLHWGFVCLLGIKSVALVNVM